MAEWRFLSGWTEAELAPRLTALAHLPASSPADFDQMSERDDWRPYGSEAVLAHEPPGPPLPDGPFERAWRGVERYAFSDPEIVTAHFEPGSPLLGRRLLLELKVLGLRYLVGVAIGQVREDVYPGRTVRGFRLHTLAGHIEQGAEWFLLSKDHDNGEIRFEIAARWRPGEFPNLWSRVGFAFLGRRYQDQWHRRAHHRLHVLARDPSELRDVRGGRLVHSGPEITLHGRRPAGRTASPAVAAVGLGAMTGLRSFSGLAAVAAARGETGPARGESWLERKLAEPGVAALVEVLAAGEMLADKVPGMPARTEPLPLAGRVLFGGLVGALAARRGKGRPWLPALIGAATAGATAIAATRLREAVTRGGFPDWVVGLVEDGLVLVGRVGKQTVRNKGVDAPP